MMSVSDKDLDIRFEDQQKINDFSKLHIRFKHLNIEISKMEEDLNKLKDFKEDLESYMEDTIDYNFADCFIEIEIGEAEKLTKQRIKDLNSKISEKSDRKNEIRKLLDSLKLDLYAKFGNAINLEE